MQQAILNKENKELKKMELPDAIFKAKVSKQLLFDVVQMYLNNTRQGDGKAKFRHEVAGSTRKIYQQKGSGRARHGSIRANIFVGGGIAHPPRTRDWSYTVPQAARVGALISALSLKQTEKKIVLVEDLPCKEIKTKTVVAQLKKWGLKNGVMVVDSYHEKLTRSLRNVPWIWLKTADQLNAFDLFRAEYVVFTEGAVKRLLERLQ